jgi:hypothetical protein
VICGVTCPAWMVEAPLLRRDLARLIGYQPTMGLARVRRTPRC